MSRERTLAVIRGQRPRLGRDGTGKGPFHVSEELALQQRFRQRAAVDRNKGHARPRTVRMNGPGHEFLPGSAFPADQHVALGVRHLTDDLEHLLNGLALPDDLRQGRLASDLSFQEQVLGGETPFLQRVPNDELDLLDFEGLGQVVVRPHLHGFHGRLRRCKRRNNQHDRFGRGFLDSLENLEPPDLGHL